MKPMKIEIGHTFSPSDRIKDQDIIDLLLKNRKVDDIEQFLNPPSPLLTGLPAFGFKKELARTMKILKEIKKSGCMVVVYTDYDADGITGGAILWETLHLLGFKAMPYVPQRKTEGYGFSVKGIDRVKKEFDPALIISVDHGISGRKEIEYAASLGIKVVVTDHHLKPKDPPDKAEAVFHIPALSGSGVSYFFSREVFLHFGNDGEVKEANRKTLENYFSTDYLALAAIGTIADLVPLIGPSRSIVYHGIRAFSQTRRRGIVHIIKEAGIVDKVITPYEIGFVIAPRINAVGRLENAIDALRLLCTHNDKQASDLASRVGGTNRERQDLVSSAVKQAKRMVDDMAEAHGKLPLVITLVSPVWNEGIIGLIASKITEAYSRPTIVMTKSDGFWKGSARSLNKFHMTDFLRSMNSLLISAGGHMLAAGFSLKDENMEEFAKKVRTESEKLLTEADLEKTLSVDAKIPLSKVGMTLAKRIETLAPFGMGNPTPSFLSDVLILEKKLFGRKMEHVKLMVKDAASNSFPMEFIAFYKTEEYRDLSKGQTVQAVYNLDINRWNGKETLRARIAAVIGPSPQ